MVQSSSRPPPARPQPIRFTGLGIALAINLLALLLLSLPREFVAPPPAPPLPEPFKGDVLPRDPPVVEVLPVPPLPVPPERPTERTTRLEAPPQPGPPVEVPPSHRFTLPYTPPGNGGAVIGIEVARAPSQVALLVAPRPPYPAILLRQGVQGTVTLRVLVGIDGRPLRVEVEQGSGNRSLDRHAREHVLQRWRFEPARFEGRPIEAWAEIPIDFVIPR
jgi:periplasmic protein TonB